MIEASYVETQDPQDALAARVAWWARLLGLSHWRLAVTRGADDAQLGPSSIARLHRTDYYESALILFRDGPATRGLYAVDGMRPDLDESIVHELLHLLCDEWDRTEEDALRLIPSAAVRRMFGDRLLMRQERVIEALAHAFALLARDLPVGQGPPLDRGRIIAIPDLLDAPWLRDDAPEPDGPTDVAESEEGS